MVGGPALDQPAADAATAPEPPWMSVAALPGPDPVAALLLCTDPALDGSRGPSVAAACSAPGPSVTGLGERRGRSPPGDLASGVAPAPVTGGSAGRAPGGGPPAGPAGRLPAGWLGEGAGIVGRVAAAGTTGVPERLAPPAPGMTGGAMLDCGTTAGAGRAA